MGMIYRKQFTKLVPRGAEILVEDGKRLAQWRLRNGRRQSAEVVECQDGKLRIRGQTKLYMARYKDGSGRTVDVPTNCKDEVAARRILSELERHAELVRAGVITAEESTTAEYSNVPLTRHLDAYERHLRAKGGAPRRISMLRGRLERLIRECRFGNLAKMIAGPVEQWLIDHNEMAAATRNTYREALVGFGNWCRRTRRLTHNPFCDLPRAEGNVNRKHQRRALTQSELMRLLKVARLRPLAEYGREIVPAEGKPGRSRKSRATWKREPVTAETVDRAVDQARRTLKGNSFLVACLERLGRERELMYRTMVLTGLRKGELASLTVGQLELTGQVAYVILDAADEKNRKGSNIPLRGDLAAELSGWIRERLTEAQDLARKAGDAIPARLPGSAPLFNVPSGLARILDRDLAAAGIPKRDERNRVVDVHALRVTFGTYLCAAGVPLRTAQAAMRHSKPELTANIYTDPKLLDVAGAMTLLPSLVISPPAQPHHAVS